VSFFLPAAKLRFAARSPQPRSTIPNSFPSGTRVPRSTKVRNILAASIVNRRGGSTPIGELSC
jgi:hypothetical protein